MIVDTILALMVGAMSVMVWMQGVQIGCLERIILNMEIRQKREDELLERQLEYQRLRQGTRRS